jgi:hypothetical protein
MEILLIIIFAFSAIWILVLSWAVLYNHYKTKSDMATIYATMTIEFSKAGLHAICEDIEEDCFCIGGDLRPLVDLINDVDAYCNPETRFSLTEKGLKTLKEKKEEDDDTV